MICQLLVLFAVIALALSGSPTSSKVSAGIKDQATGVEGLNLKIDVPFNVKDYVLGIRYAVKETFLGDGALDSLFAKKSFDVGDGSATINTNFAVSDKTVSVDCDWGVDQSLQFSLSGNSIDKVTSVGFSKMLDVLEDKKMKYAASYDLLKKKFDTCTTLTTDSLKATFSYGGDEPKASVEYILSDQNSLTPSITGLGNDADVTFTRKWDGGSLATKVGLDRNVEFTWKDRGVAGGWTTVAKVPMGDRSATSISLSRDWDL